MGINIRNALMALGVAAGVAALFAALYLIFKGDSPLTIIPYNQTCRDSDTECQLAGMPTCADCWKCGDGTTDAKGNKRCVYSLKDLSSCPCVEKEQAPCEVLLLPGTKTCEFVANDSTKWGKCVLF